jgi:hypothetical protein
MPYSAERSTSPRVVPPGIGRLPPAARPGNRAPARRAPAHAKRSKAHTEHREIEHQPSRQLIRGQNTARKITAYDSAESSSSHAPASSQGADALLKP